MPPTATSMFLPLPASLCAPCQQLGTTTHLPCERVAGGHSNMLCCSQHGRGAPQTITPQPLPPTWCAGLFSPSHSQHSTATCLGQKHQDQQCQHPSARPHSLLEVAPYSEDSPAMPCPNYFHPGAQRCNNTLTSSPSCCGLCWWECKQASAFTVSKSQDTV